MWHRLFAISLPCAARTLHAVRNTVRLTPQCLVLGGAGLLLAACSGTSTAPKNSPSVRLASMAVAFNGQQGSTNPAAQAVAVTNAGNGALTGLSIGSITYGSGGSGWLSAQLSQTAAPSTLTLTATTRALAGGTYVATVAISGAGATNNPQRLTVTLSLGAAAGSTSLASPGQSAVFLTSPNFNAHLSAQSGSQYLIAVVNTDSTHTVTEDFTLAGSFAAVGASGARAPTVVTRAQKAVRYAAVAKRNPTYAVAGPVAANIATIRQLARNHMGALDFNRQVYATLGNPSEVRARMLASGGRVAPFSPSITQTVGAVNRVYVRKQLAASCADVDSIGARTVAVGQHVIVLADTSLAAWPNSLRPDSSFYQTFANEYDQTTWPHIQTFIGNPMAYDASLSGVGKLTVTITPRLNTFGGGIVAFVNGCDFYPFASSGPQADFSNNTEMFYYWVPGTNGFDVPTWKDLLRSTAAHETKHIVSYSDRILNNSSTFERIWLEEGLAQESSEIWERHFNQATWKGNASFLQTVACELDLGSNAPCDIANNKPYTLVGGHLPFFFDYLQSESQSNSEGLGQDTPSNYGAGWTIARWATDQYATTEGSFIQSLVNEPRLNGLANLSIHTGQPIPLLLVYWNLATAIYDTVTYVAADPRTTIPSFNFGNIFYAGQTGLTCGGSPCGLFTGSGSPVFPVQPIALTTGSLSQAVHAVPGTAAAFFLLSATGNGTETLQLESGSGGAISSSSGFRVGIIRVK
jgi:hypothetical protein